MNPLTQSPTPPPSSQGARGRPYAHPYGRSAAAVSGAAATGPAASSTDSRTRKGRVGPTGPGPTGAATAAGQPRTSHKCFQCHVRASCAPHTPAATKSTYSPIMFAFSQSLLLLSCVVWPADCAKFVFFFGGGRHCLAARATCTVNPEKAQARIYLGIYEP